VKDYDMASSELQNKVYLITGANGGIGKVTALALAQRGATVVMVCRDRGKGEATQAEIKSVSGNDHVDLLIGDMSSLTSVRQLAQEVLANYPQLHALINNAGGTFSKRTLTSDGIESTLALNYVGPVLLTNLLLDRLKASAPARIINVSSSAHNFGKLKFDDLQSAQKYGSMSVYGQAKLALIMFTYDLARQLDGTGVTANVLHPGVVATGFFGDGIIGKVLKLFLLTPEQGAQTSIYLASSPEVEHVNGKFFTKSKAAASSEDSYDEQKQQQLKQVTEALIAEKSNSLENV
jgi:NAD(P)-dependent dehydrogenase (short-subunit alcohol dehydrogenase family)